MAIGQRAADRLRHFAERLDRLSANDLALAGIRPLDRDALDRARGEAERRAAELGLSGELTDARRALSDWATRLASQDQYMKVYTGSSVDPAGLVSDRMALAASLADAAAVVLLDDALDSDTADVLLGPWATLLE